MKCYITIHGRLFIIIHNSSCRKVMFSEESVILFTGGQGISGPMSFPGGQGISGPISFQGVGYLGQGIWGKASGGRVYPPQSYKSGQYTSYWHAFQFYVNKQWCYITIRHGSSIVQYKVHCNTILLSSCILATERVVIDLMERMLNGVDLTNKQTQNIKINLLLTFSLEEYHK